MFSILVVLILSSSSVFAIDLNGYGNSKWGMTIEQVLKSENSELNKWGRLDGDALIKNGHVKIGSYDYALRYIFDSGSKKLIRASLILSDMEAASLKFKDIEKRLILKYSEPVYSEPFNRNKIFNGDWSEKAESIWKLGKTQIKLFYYNDSKNNGLFIVEYSHISNSDEVNL